MPLPFRNNDHEEMPDIFRQVQAGTSQNQVDQKKNVERQCILTRLLNIHEDMIEKGYVVECNHKEDGLWYIAHNGDYHQQDPCCFRLQCSE